MPSPLPAPFHLCLPVLVMPSSLVVLPQVWMAILRFFAGLMVWLTIALVNAALAGCTLYAYNLSGLLSRAGQWGSVISDKLPKGQDPTGQLSQSTSHI